MNGPVEEWVIECAGCEVTTGGYVDSGEAEYLAGIHNDLHHGGRDDAIVTSIDEGVAALDVGGAA